MAQQMTPEMLAKKFVESYFMTMQKDKNQMINFYSENSIWTYNGEAVKGLEKIKHKLASLGFK